MNWDNFQNDPLDELLHKAQWPVVQPEQIERLQLGWKRTVRRRATIRNATAAGLALIPVIGLIAVLANSNIRVPAGNETAKYLQNAPSANFEKKPDREQLVADSQLDMQTSAVQIVREPDAFELALAISHQKQAVAAKSTANIASRSTAAADPITAAIEQLANKPDLDVAVVAKSISAKLPDVENQLCHWLQIHATATDRIDISVQPLADKRRAAIRLLGTIATSHSEPVLSASLRNSDCPSEVFQAIARISTPQQLAMRAKSETSADRQQIWMSELLKQTSTLAVANYLELVIDPTTSLAALLTIKQISNPPLDILFSAMNGPRVRIREAAARVLGTISNAAISQRLVEMTTNPATRREALIGLMSSSDEVAKSFLLHAEHDLSLAATVRAINHRFFVAVH